MCGAAQVSRVAYEVPVGLREHPRSEAEGSELVDSGEPLTLGWGRTSDAV